jgi:hypothetical protein
MQPQLAPPPVALDHTFGARSPRRPRRSPTAGLTRTSWVAIVAVTLSVAVLSSTRMHLYAVHANERDAVRLLERLGQDLGRLPAADPTASPTAAPPLALSDLASSEVLREQDLEWLDDGRLLRRHGYLFALTQTPDQPPAVEAWPWRYAQTGRAAYRWVPGQGLLGHPNAQGHFDGPDLPPTPTADWVTVPASLR